VRATARAAARPAIAAACLPLIGRTTSGAIAGVVAFGLGFSVATIARPALLATVSGLITAR
jgi:hypothetical protein